MSLKVKVRCIQCGKDFSVYPAWVRKGRKFCSRECKADWQRENLREKNNPNFKGGDIELTCESCGRKFKVLRWRTFRKFCSLACSAKVQGLKNRTRFHTCTNCGKVFYGKRPNRLRYFCSKKCEGEFNRGKNNPFYNGKFSEETLRKIIKARHTKPNRAETKLINMMEKHELPFRYVGNGEVIINGKNPDFIHMKDKKKVIELFGIYWHSPLYQKVKPTMTYQAIKKHYDQCGYMCLVIWDVELGNERYVIKKISAFVGGEKTAQIIVAE